MSLLQGVGVIMGTNCRLGGGVMGNTISLVTLRKVRQEAGVGGGNLVGHWVSGQASRLLFIL